MTQEEKQLLLKDLCARLPYRINVLTEDNDKGHIIGVDDTENGVFVIYIIEDGDSYSCYDSIENFKPYLRPISSMTGREETEWHELTFGQRWITFDNVERCVDWLNAHNFDYRGLIEKGLALEAPEDMYK